jgi:hypothetical protein
MQQRCARPCQAGLAARDASLCLFKTSRGAPRRPRAVADSAYRDTLNSSGPVSAADAEPCSSGRSAAQCTLPSVLAARLRLPSVCSTSVVLGLGLGHQLLLPLLGSAHAAETISGSGVELFRQFLVGGGDACMAASPGASLTRLLHLLVVAGADRFPGPMGWRVVCGDGHGSRDGAAVPHAASQPGQRPAVWTQKGAPRWPGSAAGDILCRGVVCATHTTQLMHEQQGYAQDHKLPVPHGALLPDA